MDASGNKKGKQGRPQPPPGYPTLTPGKQKKSCPCCPHGTAKKGDKSFIEGCLAALCCCWLCEICCD